MFRIHTLSFTKILLMELKKIFKLINIIPILLIPFFLSISTILIVVNNNIVTHSGASLNLTKALWLLIPALYISLLTWKILTDVFSSENMDKNIVLFLTNNKHIVFFSKLISNIIIFTFPILIFICIQWFTINIFWTGSTITGYSPIAIKMIMFYIQNIIFYTFLALSIQFLISWNIRKWIKNLSLIFILLLVIIFYWIIPRFITADTQLGIAKIFFNYDDSSIKTWVYYVPIINIITIPMSLSLEMQNGQSIVDHPITGTVDALPFIIETLAMIGIIWFFMTDKVKEYLCT